MNHTSLNHFVSDQILKGLENVVWFFYENILVFDTESLSCSYKDMKKSEIRMKYVDTKTKKSIWISHECYHSELKNYHFFEGIMTEISKKMFIRLISEDIRTKEWKYKDQIWEVSKVCIDSRYDGKKLYKYLYIDFKNKDGNEIYIKRDVFQHIKNSWFLKSRNKSSVIDFCTPNFLKTQKNDIIDQISIDFNDNVIHYYLEEYLKKSSKIGNQTWKFNRIYDWFKTKKYTVEFDCVTDEDLENYFYIKIDKKISMENKEFFESLIQEKFLQECKNFKLAEK